MTSPSASASPSSARVRVAVVGATGYVGGELIRLLDRHPNVELTGLWARERDAEPAEDHRGRQHDGHQRTAGNRLNRPRWRRNPASVRTLRRTVAQVTACVLGPNTTGAAARWAGASG